MSGEEILLRKVRAADADALFPLIYRTRVCDTLLWDGPESYESYSESFKQRERQAAAGEIHMFTLLERASEQPMGNISVRPMPGDFRADIGLWIGEPYQGKGYGTQAVRQAVHYGFETLGLAKIEATAFVGNWASRRIFEKNGFTLEGTIRRAVKKRGALVDEWLLGILPG